MNVTLFLRRDIYFLFDFYANSIKINQSEKRIFENNQWENVTRPRKFDGWSSQIVHKKHAPGLNFFRTFSTQLSFRCSGNGRDWISSHHL